MINPYIFRNRVAVPDALYDFVSTDIVGSQASWKNRLVAAAVSENMLYNSSGLLPSEGTFSGTITQHFIDGPNYTKGAIKVVLPATVGGETSGAFYKPYFNRQFPVANYTFKFKVKTAVAGVTQKIRWGFSTTSPTNLVDADDNWQTVTGTFNSTNNSFNYYFTIGTQIGFGSQSVLIDELQLYPTLSTIPAYTSDGNDGHANKPFGTRYPISKNGDFVTNAPMAILSPAYPDYKNWAAMSFLVALRVTSDATQIILSSLDDTYLVTASTTLSYIITSGEVQSSIAPKNRTGKLTNQGFVFLGFTWDNDGSIGGTSYINEVEIAIATGLVSGLKAQVLQLLSRLPNTSTFVGDLAFVKMWDVKLTSAQWKSAIFQGRERLKEMGAPAIARNWYIAEGDSITASYSPPQGESFAHQMATELFLTTLYIGHLNLATGGHTMSLVESDLGTMINRILEARMSGGQVVVSLLIGRNDYATLTSNAACSAYWVRLKAYYTACRNAGAKVIAITCLPSGTAAPAGGAGGTWETYRNYLNGLMRADSTAYDALADFGNSSVSIMGDVATCELSTPTRYYDTDGVHPYPAGHTILKGIIKPIIEGLL